MARPKHKVDPELVKQLAFIGCSAEEIAVLLELPEAQKKVVDAQGVERRFYATIRRGRVEMHRALKSQLIQMALKGNVPALIFALKAYCGLRDGGELAPIQQNLIVQLTRNQVREVHAEAAPHKEKARRLLAEYRPNDPNSSGENGNGNGHG